MGKAQAIKIKKIHRSIGIVLVFFLLILAVTGIVLNHSDGIGLADRPVPAFVAGWYYHDELSSLEGYRVERRHVYLIGSDVYVEDRAVATCVGDLDGAITIDGQIVALCGGELLLMSMNGELIERLGPVHGVPDGIGRLGRHNADLVLDMSGGPRRFDLATLEANPVSGDVEWQEPSGVPAELTRALLADVVSWEKFIMDVHSGRIFGGGGVWLADLVAALLVVMSVSGLVLGRFPYRKEPDSGSE